MKKTLATALLIAMVASAASAAPVVNWVATNGDAGFSGGSETTSSPITTDADAETIVGSFPAVTLAIGESIELSGSVNITGNSGTIPGNQFRWGLFDAPGVPASGSGAGYVGVWAAAPAGGAANLVTANGSTSNPYSGSASTAVVSASDPEGDTAQFGTEISFTLEVTRLDATQITVAATLSNAGNLLIEWPATTAPASPGSFSYDAVGFLLGGSTNATVGSFSNITVTGGSPPIDSDSDGMPDDYETANGLDPNLDDAGADLDNDSLTNIQEYRGADGSSGTGDETFPNDPDSDDDNVNDGMELSAGTDPLSPDSDGDGLDDGVETNTDTFVDANDTGTDPLAADSDGDGVADGVEVAAGTDPNDPNSNFGSRLLGIDFNRSDSLSAPSQSRFRTISGSATQADNSDSYTKTIGTVQITVAQPGATALEFRGGNGDTSRAIPGGDISVSFLVADFVATREGAISITLANLPAGTYLWKSYHLEPFTGAALGFAQGATTTSPNTIEARIAGTLLGSVQPTALGSSGLNTTFIDDHQVPTLAFSFIHDGAAPVTIELSSTDANGTENFLLLNGFEIFQPSP